MLDYYNSQHEHRQRWLYGPDDEDERRILQSGHPGRYHRDGSDPHPDGVRIPARAMRDFEQYYAKPDSIGPDSYQAAASGDSERHKKLAEIDALLERLGRYAQ